MVKADQAKLVIRDVGMGQYQLAKKSVDFRFCVANPNAATLDARIGEMRYVIPVDAGMRCGATDDERNGHDDRPPRDRGAMALFAPSGKNAYAMEVTLRSAEGVTYYLGELMRRRLCVGGPPDCASSRDASPTIVADEGRPPGDPLFTPARRSPAPGDLVSVRYMGETYDLPGASGDRSTQVLAILGQLVNLNKSAKDMPGSNIVTLIGH
jgi:hypothetical protein